METNTEHFIGHSNRAVEAPHPGLSYNPSFKDHQNLLNLVKEREEKIIKKEQHLERVTTSMFKKVPTVERDIADLKEKRSGLDDDDVQENPESEDDTELTSVNPPIIVKRKDAKARRKQREQREIKQQLLMKKQEKKKITDLHR